jgi:hypothetical protein
MRSCFVLDLTDGFDDAGAARLRDAGLPAFRAVGRVAVLGFDLGFVTGSSEVLRGAIRPHHLSPTWANHPAGQESRSAFSASRYLQQRSDRA